MAAALGLGLEPGDWSLSLGTSGTVYAGRPRPLRTAPVSSQASPMPPGQFLPLVCTLNATKVTDTVGRWLGLDHDGLADAGSPRPRAVPTHRYWSRTSTVNAHRISPLPRVRGPACATTHRGRIWLAAAHEGVVCGLLAGVDALASAGASVGGSLHLIGGQRGARPIGVWSPTSTVRRSRLPTTMRPWPPAPAYRLRWCSGTSSPIWVQVAAGHGCHGRP